MVDAEHLRDVCKNGCGCEGPCPCIFFCSDQYWARQSHCTGSLLYYCDKMIRYDTCKDGCTTEYKERLPRYCYNSTFTTPAPLSELELKKYETVDQCRAEATRLLDDCEFERGCEWACCWGQFYARYLENCEDYKTLGKPLPPLGRYQQ